MSNIADQSASRTGAVVVARSAIWRATAIAAAGAAVANLVVALIAKAADVSFQVAPMGSDTRQDIPVVMFAVASVVGALIGGGVAQLLARRAGAARTFVIVGAVGTALSLITPIAADADAAMKWVLLVSHVIAGAIIVPLIARRLPR